MTNQLPWGMVICMCSPNLLSHIISASVVLWPFMLEKLFEENVKSGTSFIQCVLPKHFVFWIPPCLFSLVTLYLCICSSRNTVFTELQDEVFSLNLVLKCMRSWISVWSIEPDWCELDFAEPTNICITKLSCVDRRDNRAWHKLTQFSFFGLCPSSNFLEKLDGSEAGTVTVIRQRGT